MSEPRAAGVPGVPPELSATKRAIVEIRELRAKFDAAERAANEPIAIVGLGCRFPGADGPDAYWRLLRDGTDAISKVPLDRWDVDAMYDPDPEAWALDREVMAAVQAAKRSAGLGRMRLESTVDITGQAISI